VHPTGLTRQNGEHIREGMDELENHYAPRKLSRGFSRGSAASVPSIASVAVATPGTAK
jgi:hypothetical protein